ncbi:MAG: MoaD/ThiS family protein [Chloroflexi bacterium]|nr:MoaD/ThiS family protein [Chloroflexota bacterium]
MDERASIKFYRQEWHLAANRPLRELLEEAGVAPDHVVAIREKRVISADTLVLPGDKIRLVNAISGG